MKISHEQYLKQLLQIKQNELEYIELEHRIAIAEFNTKKKMIIQQINSTERQLENK